MALCQKHFVTAYMLLFYMQQNKKISARSFVRGSTHREQIFWILLYKKVRFFCVAKCKKGSMEKQQWRAVARLHAHQNSGLKNCTLELSNVSHFSELFGREKWRQSINCCHSYNERKKRKTIQMGRTKSSMCLTRKWTPFCCFFFFIFLRLKNNFFVV